MKAVETVLIVFEFIIKEISMLVLLLHDLTFGNSWSLSGELVLHLSSVFHSCEHTFSFNLSLELVHIDLVNLISLHGVLDEALHLLYFIVMFFITFWSFALLFLDKGSEDLHGRVLVDLMNIFFLITLILAGIVFISKIAHNNEQPE